MSDSGSSGNIPLLLILIINKMAWSISGVIKGFCTFIFIIFHIVGGLLLIVAIAYAASNYPRLIFLEMHMLVMLALLLSATVALHGISTGVLHQLI